MHIRTTCAAFVAAFVPVVALAQGEAVVGGQVNLTYDIDNGLDHSENTIEGYIAYENSGFFTELWAGSLHDDPNDDAELEFYLGYGTEFGDLGVALQYVGYFLTDSGHDHNGVGVELSYPLGESVTGALYSEIDPDSKDWFHEISAEFELNDRWSTRFMYGVSDADDNAYGEAALTYAVNDTVFLEMLYEDSDDADGLMTFSVGFETSVFGG
ncbi:hypothetical protein E4Z66_02230 [Aliishimia ponticola]|uniref:Porin n=1 Tax=Aliishimia ponticola TaxID=2499833 RepID=A0A4S4NQF6_9RHOB|nr:hypothetical protein [Aliishimia ponticola]THH38410.1 hypothetical protein E4Z66_02230 [Aliishimia ponticola]